MSNISNMPILTKATDEYDFMNKIVLVGNPRVGKTNILYRLTGNGFCENNKPTIGMDIGTKSITIKNKKIKIQLWDTAGQENFKALSSAYYRATSGAIIVYDISDELTFGSLETWIKEIKSYEKDTKIIIIGNKLDLCDNRQVNFDDAKSFCSKHGYSYVETSAKDNVNIDHALMLVVEEILDEILSKLQHNDQSQENTIKPINKSIILDSHQIASTSKSNCEC